MNYKLNGNTYPVKDELKKLGFRWETTQKAWITDNPDIYQKGVQLVPQRICTTTTGSGKKKTCWECGGSFTYSFCIANGGDWNENGGYCGC